MMDSSDGAAPFSWPAVGASFNQPYRVEHALNSPISDRQALRAQLTDWGTPVYDNSRALVGSQTVSGKSFDDIPLTMEVVIGHAQVPVSALMSLTKDQVVLLNKRFGDPVEIRVNGQTIGRGEIVSDNDDNIIGVKLTEVLRS
ncbi:FliM/FliN family flagellar motor switch protein [Agrobacterium rosae]|uniref:FliM/FliN family flagellar motor switch protein n=2 Tax=Agrobacterium rosae TaxID=1972867 RepID=UPI0019D3634B|nr:FliM/FliN family flagellar motor switch protein [Agrobacterium rosae]MBN7806152.1 FliM/FliN family flagellar motor switch protein [Agrobacterium rosae]